MDGEPGAERKLRFRCGAFDPRASAAYPSNRIVSSRYTWYSFLPVNLWEQLHKFGNVYFLVISIIMYVGEKTPLFVGTIKAFSTLGLLVMMMSVTAAMSLFDDLRRKEADREINGMKARVIDRDHVVGRKRWEEVAVGDIIVVEKDEEFPADVVPFYCSGDGGHCYVSTANLDGETNLKLKAAPTATQAMLAPPGAPEGDWNVMARELDQLSGEVGAEAPNSNIHDFKGNLSVEGRAPESLNLQHLLMRGTVLRNTALCVGIVVYTGGDTRMAKNSRPAPMKQSNLERITNTAMFIILAAQSVFALTSAFYHVETQKDLADHWYLYPPEIMLPQMLGWWLTFFTLYSNLMPISLYPTAEFCNAFQCYFIRNDQRMYYKSPGFNSGLGFGAKARSSNLCQELGQVGYMFSDKTGTLTQNDMQLKRVFVAGRKYGTFEAGEEGFNGGEAMQAARMTDGAQAIDDFLEALAVSHTVMATHGSNGSVKYEAESPDEFALVDAASSLGWSFQGRRGSEVAVEVTGPRSSRPSKETYTLLATNAFNSARKRMSVVVQKGTKYLVLVKGADNVMLERAEGVHKQLEQDLKDFSMQGLRTLVIGSRELSREEVSAWTAKYDVAQRETQQRDEKLADVAEEIERSLKILGATAIEDKLQDGVPETIEKIRKAGIKLWVLTGDKLETARNIGFSTKVLTSEMTIQIIDPEDGVMDLDLIQEKMEDVPVELKALMVTGRALQELLSPDCTYDLLEVAKECSVLIACRVSPSQKAELVRLVREGITPQPVTLAVGDGANDVPMIQEAQVGVGIAGREGRQAVNNSDFAIAQFKYLQDLMLVHGRWNYRRACKFTLFTFWRNMVQVLMIMYYTWISGYSGTSLFEDWIRLSFNLLCTLPILPVGCTDEDVPAEVALEHPELYSIGPRGKDLNTKKTLHTLAAALAHSVVLTLLTISAFPSMDLKGNGDYYTFGTTCYTCLLIDVNYRAGFLTHTHNIFTISALVLSFVLYVAWLFLYPSNDVVSKLLSPNMYMVPVHMITCWYFWFCVLTVPLLAMMLDVYITFNYHHFFPDIKDKVTRSNRHGSPCKTDEAEDWRDACPALMGGSCSSWATDSGSEGSEAEGMPRYDAIDHKQIDLTWFGQRKWRTWRPTSIGSPAFQVLMTGLIAGIVTLPIGLCAYLHSESMAQVRIMYQNPRWDQGNYADIGILWKQDPVGTRVEERNNANCTEGPRGGARNCTATVTLHRQMRPPILVYYAIGPYYQNYNAYMRSEVPEELNGKHVGESDRAKRCVEPTRVDAAGENIVPCGMKATSFFNDTFRIFDSDKIKMEFSTENIAWGSDVARYKNPPDYPNRPNTSWLYERCPGVVKEAEGVENKLFIDWMRPSAVPRLWNRVGVITHSTLKKGDTIHVEIGSNYPMDRISDGFKVLVLTEFGALGARHSGFGRMLMVSGSLCGLLAAAAFVTTWCFPQGGVFQQKIQAFFDPDPVEMSYEEDDRGVAQLSS